VSRAKGGNAPGVRLAAWSPPCYQEIETRPRCGHSAEDLRKSLTSTP
jgi:hypothetical protein